MEKSSKTTQSEHTKTEDMNEGVRILLERMETHPEEFSRDYLDKWGHMTEQIAHRVEHGTTAYPFLSDEEVNAIYNKLTSIRREAFTAEVISILIKQPDEYDVDQLKLPYMTVGGGKERFRISSDGSLGIGTSMQPVPAITLGSQTLTEAELRRIKEAFKVKK